MTTATWILALATVGLAITTVAALFVAVRMARTDRLRDDARRAEDRKQDAQLRKDDRERDDRLRREAADEWDRRTRAEQRAREDYEARQVTVGLTTTMPQHIEISTPVTYPIKQVGADIAHWTGSNLGISPSGTPSGAAPPGTAVSGTPSRPPSRPMPSGQRSLLTSPTGTATCTTASRTARCGSRRRQSRQVPRRG